MALALGLIGAPGPAFALSGAEEKFASLINQERAQRGRPTLSAKSDLVAVAREHSARMAADGTIYHNSNLAHEISGNWWALGENVGMGPTVESLHDAFMNSPGHKANLVDTDYNQTGVGVVVSDDTIYVTEVFAGRPSSTASFTSAKRALVDPRSRTRPRRLAAPPRTMAMLLRLAGLDAKRVDPASGRALGL